MTIKKNLIFTLLIMFISTGVFADTLTLKKNSTSSDISNKKKDKATIYLKNGSVIHGVLEQNDEIVVIKTSDGNIFAFSKTDIEKIELNTKPALGNGSFHQFGFGVSHSQTEFNGAFNIVNGYQLASKIYFGLGIGIEGYYRNVYVPVVLDIQYHPFSDWDSQPFIGANVGKLLMQSDEKNGWLTGFKIGFTHPLGNKVDICTTVGYRHGVIERESYYNPWDLYGNDPYRRYEINRLEFGLGFMIK